MKTSVLCAALAVVALAVLRFALPLTDGDNGHVVLMPYRNEALGIEAVVPAGWAEIEPGAFARGDSSDNALVYVVTGLPGEEIDTARELVREKSKIAQLPPSTGSRRSGGLDWELYTLHLGDTESGSWRASVALAESDFGTYLCVVQAMSGQFEKEKAILESLFTHALRNIVPLTGV